MTTKPLDVCVVGDIFFLVAVGVGNHVLLHS